MEMLSKHVPDSGHENIWSSFVCFLSRQVAFLSLFPLSLRNILLLSLVPLMPACVGKELAGMITVFLYLSSIILIPDFLTSCSQLTW